MMVLAKSFFGFVPESVTDYILVYSICAVIIIVGLIILSQLKKKDRPATPAEMEKNCDKVLETLNKILSDVDNPKVTGIKLSNEIMKAEMNINKLVYSSTAVIEEKRDITFEGIRSSLQTATQYLDEANAVIMQKDDQKNFISKTIDQISSVKAALAEVNARYEKFGN